MTKFVRPLLFVFVILSFVLTACGTPATPQTVTEVQTQIVNQVQVVTATPDASQPTALPDGSVQITGSGATFPLPLYTDWTYA
jgi:ABC-type phosphate transport system substrate-binding protein